MDEREERVLLIVFLSLSLSLSLPLFLPLCLFLPMLSMEMERTTNGGGWQSMNG
jgi:hypothetical protein